MLEQVCEFSLEMIVIDEMYNWVVFRVPVELSAGISLIPLHSVTASALLTSLLSLSNQNWGCLSEGIYLCSLSFSLLISSFVFTKMFYQ